MNDKNMKYITIINMIITYSDILDKFNGKDNLF